MSNPPANWYPDPAGSPELRYWDGAAWTNHLRPMSAPVAVAPTPEVRPMPMEPDLGYRQAPPINDFFPSEAPPSKYGNTTKVNVGPRGMGFILIAFGAIFASVALFGLLIGGLSSLMFSGVSSAGAGAVEAQGKIVELQMNGADCTPIASFEVDGETYTAVSTATISPCNVAVGRNATVSYIPGDISGTAVMVIDEVELFGFASVMFIGGPLFGAVIGIVILVGGIAMVVKNPKKST